MKYKSHKIRMKKSDKEYIIYVDGKDIGTAGDSKEGIEGAKNYIDSK